MLLEQEDNEYIVMCENEYVKNATIKILALNENIDSIYHFVGQKVDLVSAYRAVTSRMK